MPTATQTRAFRLRVEDGGLATLTFDLPDKKVNVFTREAIEELDETIGELAVRDDISCLVLLSGKSSGFIAGADVSEIAGVEDPTEAAEGSRAGHRLFAAWEALPFPTVAAIRGTCLGGGTELALASTHIVVSDSDGVKIGLPEVRLGILPGWGGCTRLPERVGVADALDMILTGRNVRARKALAIGLADAMVPDADFGHAVRAFAESHAGERRRSEGGFDLKSLLMEKNPFGRKVVFDQARKTVMKKTGGHYPAPLRAIEVVRVGLEDGREAGFDAEARAIGELAVSPIAKNLIHIFHLMEEAKKDDRLEGEVLPVGEVGVLGAGVMGGGIAQLVAAKLDLPVRLKDVAHEPLASGMDHAAELFDELVSRRRLRRPEARRKMALLRPTLDYAGFSRVDLVIEAIVEKLEIKQAVFAETAEAVSEKAILASNTSSLSIDAIGEKTPHRGRVVGMHFFNPVHKMPLVEVVAGPRTEPSAVRTVVDLSRRLGKTPVVVDDAPGFLVNRLLMFYLNEAMWLLDEGHRIEDVDRAMTLWGMPMGPVTLTDEVGIDVAVKVAGILRDAFGDRLPMPGWMGRAPEDDRLGAKNGRGFYLYEDGKRTEPDPSAYELLGLEPRIQHPDLDRMVDRMVLPMLDEAARCLAEGVVGSAGELDLAMVMGTGFPPFRGGLCRWGDQQGLSQLHAALQRLAERKDDRFRPSEALAEAVEAGGMYARWG